MNVEEYIKQHDAINYCEAIIYPDGTIEDAIPSHLDKLKKITNMPRKVLYKMMPENASPIDWLLGYTKCVAVWWGLFKYDSLTQEQLNTIQELVNHGIMHELVRGFETDEYSRCALLEKYYRNEITLDDIPDKRNNKIFIMRQTTT